MALLDDFDETSSERKIRSRHNLNMFRTSFESLEVIEFEKIIFVNFLHFFVPFCNQNGIGWFSISPNLTSQPCLNHVWNGFYALLKFGRNHSKVPCWPFFMKIDGATWDHKFWSRHRKNILRPDFESLGPILFISNFIFIFSCLFVTRTVSKACIAHLRYENQ